MQVDSEFYVAQILCIFLIMLNCFIYTFCIDKLNQMYLYSAFHNPQGFKAAL